MKPFTTSSDHDVLENAMPDHGTPEIEVEGATQPGTTLTTQTPMLTQDPALHQLCQPMSWPSQLLHQ